ncbi:MAG: hypothetical protein Q8P34_11605 [Bacteroidota bacterium]|nr:hypothetical protein [Bacteroidota bacterium]
MSIEEIKLQIFRQVDALDATKLKEFYGIMLNYINSKRDTDEWIGVTSSEKQGIIDAIEELNDGKGIPHKQVIERLRKKYTHD